jgi:hypothetical protein
MKLKHSISVIYFNDSSLFKTLPFGAAIRKNRVFNALQKKIENNFPKITKITMNLFDSIKH